MSRVDAAERMEPRALGGPDLVNVLLLLAVAGVITVLGVFRAPSLSALDEATHVDYVWAVANGRIPAAGSDLAPEVREEWSCRSQENVVVPPCGVPAEADSYPARGENYNFGHPPLYYALTALAVRASSLTGFDPSFVTVARLTGALWLGSALVAFYAVLRRWALPRSSAVLASVLLASAPSVAHASSTVTNDAPAVLAGVAAFWILTRVTLAKKLGWLVPTLVAFAVASTKLMTSIAPLSVAGVLFLLGVRSFRRGARDEGWRLWAISAGMGGATLVVLSLWRWFQSARGDADWRNPVLGFNTSPVEGAPLDEWMPTLFSAFGITHDFWLQASVTSAYVIASARFLSVLLTAAPFVNLATFNRGDDPRRLTAWAALLGVSTVPVFVQVQTYLGDDHYFRQVTSRYALSLIPLTLATLIMVPTGKRGRAALFIVTLAVFAALILSFSGVL